MSSRLNRSLAALFAPPVQKLRRLLGIETLVEHNLRMQDEMREELRRVTQISMDTSVIMASIARGLLDPKSVVQSAEYARAKECLRLLSPMDVSGASFVRIGNAHDGGYIMVDDIDSRTTPVAYSIGIGTEIGWDLQIAEKGIDVYMYDDTIVSPPQSDPRFHFRRIGVTGVAHRATRQTLPEMLDANGHGSQDRMLLKIDVEGCEWDVFAHCPAETVRRFSQIVVEFHGLMAAVSGHCFESVRGVLDKLRQTHQSVHVHALNCGWSYMAPHIVLPDVLEVTYVSRAVYGDRLAPSERYFPTALDAANVPYRVDMPLGDFGRRLVRDGQYTAE
jgi:hypothetical protein